MLGDDLSERAIAAELGLSRNTVKFYACGARRKLGVQSTAAAVAIVVRMRERSAG